MGQENDKKERIVQTAIAFFGEQGYDATTVEEIAHQAKIAKGSVYLYYPSKEEIYRDVIIRAAEARRRHVQVVSAGPDEDVRRTLARLITNELRFARSERRYYRLLISNDQSDSGKYGKEIKALRLEFLSDLTDQIRVGMLRGVIREGNPVLLGQLLNGMVRGAYQLLVENSAMAVDQIVLSILDLLWRGWGTSS